MKFVQRRHRLRYTLSIQQPWYSGMQFRESLTKFIWRLSVKRRHRKLPGSFQPVHISFPIWIVGCSIRFLSGRFALTARLAIGALANRFYRPVLIAERPKIFLNVVLRVRLAFSCPTIPTQLSIHWIKAHMW